MSCPSLPRNSGIASGSSRVPFAEMVEDFGGSLIYTKTQREVDAENLVPIYEYTWNHTTLQVLKLDKDVTYLQSGFPNIELVEEMIAKMVREEVEAQTPMIREKIEQEVAARWPARVESTVTAALDAAVAKIKQEMVK